ncbi:MAG: futalosine hydrolase [Desulfovibrio sp.]|nr:futalosine hydrolase [Desulfovibrio sp.]
MALLILAPTPEELLALAPGILPGDIREMRPYPANLKGRDVLFYATGIGPANAAMATGYCFGLTSSSEVFGHPWKVELCLLAGLAGAFDLEKRPLRKLYLVREEIWPEYGLNDGANVVARAFHYPQWKRSENEAVYDRVELADLSSLNSDSRWLQKMEEEFPPCKSLSVAGVTASFARARQLESLYHADLENMEGFSVAFACLRAGAPCVEIRSVSNKIGPRSRDEKDFSGALKSLGIILPQLNLI